MWSPWPWTSPRKRARTASVSPSNAKTTPRTSALGCGARNVRADRPEARPRADGLYARPSHPRIHLVGLQRQTRPPLHLHRVCDLRLAGGSRSQAFRAGRNMDRRGAGKACRPFQPRGDRLTGVRAAFSEQAPRRTGRRRAGGRAALAIARASGSAQGLPAPR
jgi:hypothetical protein